MVKKLFWVLALIAVVGFVIWSKDPLDDTVNFIIGGSIPGTKVALGFWPTIGIVGTILLLVRRGIKNAHLQMLESTAKQIKTEQAHKAFEQQNSGAADSKNRSVIAARKTELSV